MGSNNLPFSDLSDEELDQLEEELQQEEDSEQPGCGLVLSGGHVCGEYNYFCFKCNHGDGEDPRLPKHLKNARKR